MATRRPGEPLRVALICPYSLSVPGGVQGQVVGLARAITELGHLAHVVAPVDGPLDNTGLLDLDGAVVSAGKSTNLPANGSVAPVSLSPMAWRRTLATIKGASYDVLHLHEPLAPGAGYICLSSSGLPMLGTFHRSGDSAPYRWFGALARRAVNRLDIRCAVSSAARDTAASAVGGDYRIVGNGIDTDRFADSSPWPVAGPTLLFVGRHEQRKGLRVVLDAYERACRSGTLPKGTILWVTGQGPETESLRRLHPGGDHLEWLGRVDDKELARRMMGAHVLLAPSLGGESFGVVLLEAMIARAGVIASDLPGYLDVLDSNGMTVQAGDVLSWEQAIVRGALDALSSTGICAGSALDAAVKHAEQWSMPVIAKQYIGLYNETITIHMNRIATSR